MRQTERRLPPARVAGENDADMSRMAGVLAHRILEQWDFMADPGRLTNDVAAIVERSLGADQADFSGRVTKSLTELLRVFGASDWYARLGRATILGREIPFLLPWDEGQLMEGVIDLVYRLDGSLWIADYKTDAITAEEAPKHAERYRTQSQVYKTAVAQSLGITDARFHCLFLRCATSIEL